MPIYIPRKQDKNRDMALAANAAPVAAPAPKRPALTSHNEPDGHFKQTLGKPVAAKLASVGMRIAWGGRLYRIGAISRPVQARNAQGRLVPAPLILVIRLTNGPTITAKPEDTLYREIVSAERAE